MKRAFLPLSALMILWAFAISCEEQVAPEIAGLFSPGEKFTIVATSADAPATKTAIQSDGTSIYWTNGDAINLFYGSTSSGQFTTSIAEPNATSEFTGTLTVATGSTAEGQGAKAFWAVYPYNVGNSCDGNSVTLPIPIEQSAAPGTFADKLNPSVATSPNLGLAFYNVGSWLIFSVTQEGVTSATFRGNNNEDIAGRVRVTMDNNHHPVSQVVEGAKSITINAPSGTSFIPGQLYYIVLIPQTLEQGYTLTLHKGTDLQAECVVSKEAEFVRSSYRRKLNADEGLEYTEAPPSPLTGNITFADDLVKSICVANWDTSGDGALSYEEAAAVTDLGDVFEYTDITSFNELQYFTGLTELFGSFNQCIFLSEITLPSSLISIGDNSFNGCSELAEFTIPTGVTSIGDFSFCSCTSLTEIIIPSSVTSIGCKAFIECHNLTSIDLPSSITHIGEEAFYECNSLTSIVLPSGLTHIGSFTFAGCTSLTSIILPSRLESIGYDAFASCGHLSSIEIPSSVTSIGSYAFEDCVGLTSIELPSGVKSIEYGTFHNCSSLISVTLPLGLTSIEGNAFSYCTSLESIIIPANVSEIRESAFSNCTSLLSFVLPSNSRLKSLVLYDCTSLSEITIPTRIELLGLINCSNLSDVTIPSNSKLSIVNFCGCTNLTSITLPTSVTTIESFENCSSLTSIIIPSRVTSIGERAFFGCSNLTTVSIPTDSQLTSIDNSAFYGCSSLTSITIPESVSSIGHNAFQGCSSLTKITALPTTPPSAGSGIFNGSSCVIQVPLPSVDLYKTATGWSDYASRIQAIPE